MAVSLERERTTGRKVDMPFMTPKRLVSIICDYRDTSATEATGVNR